MICNNHIVGFFAADAKQDAAMFSISSASVDILDAIDRLEDKNWILSADDPPKNPFLLSLILGQERELLSVRI